MLEPHYDSYPAVVAMAGARHVSVPLHPDTLKYLVEASGFQRVDVQFRQNVRDEDRLRRASGTTAPNPSLAALAAAIDDHLSVGAVS